MVVTASGAEPPQDSFLLHLVKQRFPTHLEELRMEGRELPDFVIRDFAKFTTCGNIRTHYATLECVKCSYRRKICLRCKRRGWCPPCMTFRQMDRTQFLQQRVIGNTPIRQYVLSLPPPLRIYLAFKPHLVSKVLQQYLKFIFQHLAKAAKKLLRSRDGAAGDRFRSCTIHHLKAGAITAIQRMATDFTVNLHFHCLVTNGVFVKLPTDDAPWFLELPPPTTDDITALAAKICRWTCDLLKREGVWQDVHEAPTTDLQTVAGYLTLADDEPRLHRFCGVASDQETDHPVGRDGIYGFNVYAQKAIRGGDRKNLRRLIRYILSPPFINKQVRPDPESADHVLIDLKRPMRDGTQVLRLTIRQLFNRLVWAIPRPRVNLLRFHGVYGSNSHLRDEVVPTPPPEKASAQETGDTRDDKEAWAELQRHTFPQDARRCRRCSLCGGRMKLVELKSDRILYRRRSGVPPDHPEIRSIIYLHKAA